MKKAFLLLVTAVAMIFVCSQQAEALSINAVPKSPEFGPNDWLFIDVKVQGYHGGPISWTAHRPDNSTVSGVLSQVKPDGTVTQEIVRDAFDNYFGNWSINYKYDNATGTANFKVNPIILTVSTDKDLYYEPDMMHVNITTSFYIPVAQQAQYFHLNFLDQKGNQVSDMQQIDIRAFQPSVIYNFHMTRLADFDPPGLYKLKVQYYNKVVEVPFLLGEYSKFMSVASRTDKVTYQVGDVVNFAISVTKVSQAEGTLTVTDPSGNVTTSKFQLFSVHIPLAFSGMTEKIGTYSYTVSYAGVTSSGSFNVVASPKPLPNIELDLFPDKFNYRPGDVISLKIHTSQVVANTTELWAVSPKGVEYPRELLPVTSLDTILPFKIGENYTTGLWVLYLDYDGIVKNVPFNVVGSPVDENEFLNPNQFSIPRFVSFFGTSTSFNQPVGIAIDSDNNVYVVDAGNFEIKKFDPSGKLLLSWGSAGSGNGQFMHPSGIFVGKKYVYVADTGNARIEMFDKQGNFIYAWGGYGDSRGMFHTPVGLAADSSNNLFVADSGRPTIQIFNDQRQYTDQIKPLLVDGGYFTSLNGISFDPSNEFYVSTPDNKILKFSDIGEYMNFFGSGGTEDGRFNNPTAMVTGPKENFYVADTGNHRIQKFDSYGNFILTWGTEGSSASQFEEPVGLATDSLGNIYVVDKKNDNIQKFSLYGNFTGVIPHWTRERIAWWSEGALGNREFLLGVKAMINGGIVNATLTNAPSQHVPQWIKHEAEWWSQGIIDEKTFAYDLQYLVSKGIIRP